MTAAIYFHPEAFTTAGPKLMGRNAAGESFLRGFLRYSNSPAFWIQVSQGGFLTQFEETARRMGRNQPVHAVTPERLDKLRHPGSVFYPGPGIGEHAFHRGFFGHGAWSLCGITHTTSSAGAMDAVCQWITSPVQPWDAVICTSEAVKRHVEGLLKAKLAYLGERLGIQKAVLPQLPVIPLGIHPEDFEFSEAHRIQARESLGLDESTLVVLFMGRLSFHAKAHPLVMYQALEKAAGATAKKVVLIECGWHANEPIRTAYAEAAQWACPSIRVITLDGRIETSRNMAWSAADLFCSLSDNIQETFGITPLEAMARGLPVVVSDWDGYKDTVRDGVDGFRVPTTLPPDGNGHDLAYRHATGLDSYDMYCGHACMLTAVDLEASAQAFIRLFESSALRKKMGCAGKLRVIEHFSWKQIIPRYEALWDELAKIRKASCDQNAKLLEGAFWPQRQDPFFGFSGYPTKVLGPEVLLGLVDQNLTDALERYRAVCRLAMVRFASYVLLEESEAEVLFGQLEQGPKRVDSLIKHFDPKVNSRVWRSLVCLLKLGIITDRPH